MKIFSAAPDGNQSADLEPARYFNLAITQINQITEWMETADRAAQPLLFHVDMYLYLAKKYPEMAGSRIDSLDVPKIRVTFDAWFERCGKKIPAKFRADTKALGDRLFDELEQLAA